MPSPQVGFNNNVKHRGRVFHIQTEDSGIARPRIMTHLFVDGGLVIKSCRTDYSDVLHSPDLTAVVRKRMKEQHKAMFIDLREGRLDSEIDEVLEDPKGKSVTAIRKSTSPKARKARSKPPGKRRSRGPGAKGAKRGRPPGEARAAAVSPSPAAGGVATSGSGATRPSASFAAPDASSIFGNSSISEQSLDDVILSYISADLDGNAKTGE